VVDLPEVVADVEVGGVEVGGVEVGGVEVGAVEVGGGGGDEAGVLKGGCGPTPGPSGRIVGLTTVGMFALLRPGPPLLVNWAAA
jgi:hypothetical protein